MDQTGILGKRSFRLDLFPFLLQFSNIVIFFVITLDRRICIFMVPKLSRLS